jgi:hypothetical protein
MQKIGWPILAGCGLVLFIAAHGLVAWSGIKLSGMTGGSLPWIAGGVLAFGLYHVIQAFGFYHVIQHARGKGHGRFHLPGGHAPDRTEIERGPHDGFLVNLGHGFVEVTICEAAVPPHFRLFFYDKHKQARSVPTNATIKIETVRRDGARQVFTFRANGDYLESESNIPEPREFRAIVHVSHGSHTHPPHEVQFSEHDRAL